jgi:hypothetical protein
LEEASRWSGGAGMLVNIFFISPPDIQIWTALPLVHEIMAVRKLVTESIEKLLELPVCQRALFKIEDFDQHGGQMVAARGSGAR